MWLNSLLEAGGVEPWDIEGMWLNSLLEAGGVEPWWESAGYSDTDSTNPEPSILLGVSFSPLCQGSSHQSIEAYLLQSAPEITQLQYTTKLFSFQVEIGSSTLSSK